MKRIRSHHAESESLDLFDAMARTKAYTLVDAIETSRFTADVSAALAQAIGNPIVLHGKRVEAMFGFVAAALGACALVKEEDSGEVFAESADLSIPDYRLVLKDGSQLLVEVKNCHEADPDHAVRLSKEYLARLMRYADLCKVPVKIAIYWSGWRLWILLDPASIAIYGSRGGISLLEAVPHNEMGVLGDFMIGTRPPLRLTLVADPSKSRSVVTSDGTNMSFDFTVGDVELYSEDRLLVDKQEKSLAFYFMMHGRWQEAEPEAVIVNDQLVSITFVSTPEKEEEAKINGFAVVGHMSTMIAGAFSDETVREKDILRLAPLRDPSAFRILLGDKLQSTQLPLWRFKQQLPSAEESPLDA